MVLSGLAAGGNGAVKVSRQWIWHVNKKKRDMTLNS